MWCGRPSRAMAGGVWWHAIAAHQLLRRGHCAAHRVLGPHSRATPQLIIQEETHITNVVDPWAGSYMMESLTQQMADAAWAIIEEVEAMGGMTKAVDSGWAKLKIEASAAEKQARIDSGKDVIVGVNKYKLKTQDAVEIREVDNVAVREAQIAQLKRIKAGRDGAKVSACAASLDGRCARRHRQPAGARHRRHPRPRHRRRGERCPGEDLRGATAPTSKR